MDRRTSTGLLLLALLLGAGCGDSPEQSPAEAEQPQAPTTEPGPPGSRPLPQVQALYEAVQKNPDDYRTRHLFALALHRQDRREEALEQFQKVVEQTSETIYKIELGVAYASLDRMEEAETTFQQALENDPSNSAVLHHLGNLAQRRGATAEAVSLYRQAIQSDPEHLMALYQLGESLRLSGQNREAYRSFEKVVGLDPKNPPEVKAFDASLFNLASLDLQMGATERAIEFLRALIQAVPQHPQAHLLLSQALGKLGREDEARAELEIHQRLSGEQPGGAPGQ